MSFRKQVQRGSLALVVLAALLASSAAHAVGPRPVLQMPVSCGQTWDASTYDGHWPDEDSIDLAQRDGDGDNISAGEPVLASADGTVMAVFTTTPVDSNAYCDFNDDDDYIGGENRVYLDHGGWATFYIHLETVPPLQVGDAVAQGEQIGRTGNAGIENAGAEDMHIHYTQAIINGIDDAEPIKFNGATIAANAANAANAALYNTYGSDAAETLTSLNCPGKLVHGFTQNAMRYQLLYKPGAGEAKIVRLYSDGAGAGATTTMSAPGRGAGRISYRSRHQAARRISSSTSRRADASASPASTAEAPGRPSSRTATGTRAGRISCRCLWTVTRASSPTTRSTATRTWTTSTRRAAVPNPSTRRRGPAVGRKSSPSTPAATNSSCCTRAAPARSRSTRSASAATTAARRDPAAVEPRGAAQRRPLE